VGGTVCIFISLNIDASSKTVLDSSKRVKTLKRDRETPPPPDTGCSLEITCTSR